MGEIKYSNQDFMLKANTLSAKINSINTAAQDASEGETTVEALKKFIELYGQLEEMICDYQSLLCADLNSLKRAGSVIKQQDTQDQGYWK